MPRVHNLDINNHIPTLFNIGIQTDGILFAGEGNSVFQKLFYYFRPQISIPGLIIIIGFDIQTSDRKALSYIKIYAINIKFIKNKNNNIIYKINAWT